MSRRASASKVNYAIDKIDDDSTSDEDSDEEEVSDGPEDEDSVASVRAGSKRTSNRSSISRFDDKRRPFKCDVCMRRFKNKSTMYLHKRGHAGEFFL